MQYGLLAAQTAWLEGRGRTFLFMSWCCNTITPAPDEALSCYIQWCSIALLARSVGRQSLPVQRACMHLGIRYCSLKTKQQVQTSAPHRLLTSCQVVLRLAEVTQQVLQTGEC